MNTEFDDHLRDALAGAADDLTIDLMPAEVIANRGRRRRTRRRVAGGCTVGALALTGGLLLTRGDDQVSTAGETSTTVTATTVPIIDGVEDPRATTGDTLPPGDAIVVTTPSTIVAAPAEDVPAEDVPAEEAPAADGTRPVESATVLPWQGGFVSIGYQYEPQPLPPLPEEISALFPAEVLALFPDGLPPTINEATEILSEAGLLDEVSAVLSEHPEAQEAIYSVPAPPPRLIAQFSEDGTAWTPIDLGDDVSAYGQMSVVGDRLVGWSLGVPDGTPADTTGTPPPERELVVTSTTDLRQWDTATYRLSTGSGDPTFVSTDIWLQSLVPTSSGWYGLLSHESWIDWTRVLPPDVAAQLADAPAGWNVTPDLDGVRLEIYAADGSTESSTFTWAELGLTSNPEPDLGYGQMTLLHLAPSGEVVETALPQGAGWGTLTVLGDQLVLIAEQVFTSTDGTTWTPVSGIPDGTVVTGAVPLGDRLLITASDPAGTSTWILDAAGDVTQGTTPDLPPNADFGGVNASPAWIAAVHDPSLDSWEPVDVQFGYEGYLLHVIDGPEGIDLTMTDEATGEVVVDRHLDRATVDAGGFYDVDENGNAVIVISDLDTGEAILRIPESVFAEAYQEAYAAQPRPDVGDEDIATPDFWLVATTDGITWYVEDLVDTDTDMSGYWPSGAVVSGGRLLFQSPDGWETRTL